VTGCDAERLGGLCQLFLMLSIHNNPCGLIKTPSGDRNHHEVVVNNKGKECDIISVSECN
jgi:hypothetical protein